MKSFWGKWKREKKNERGNLTKTWSEEMPGWDPGIHRRFLKVEQALLLSDSLLGTYWTIWAALPRPKATSSGILFVCEEQEKFRLGPWAQTISIDVYNNNRGKGKKNKEKKKKKRHHGTVNLSCMIVPKDAAASLSTCYACQIHCRNVCYNNIFQRTAV